MAKKTETKAPAAKRDNADMYAPKEALVETKKIKILVDENPKRGESAKRFSVYKNGMTVEACLEKKLSRSDIRWDIKHGYIKLV